MNKLYTMLFALLTYSTFSQAQQTSGQPIQLTAFSAQCNDGKALINWTTGTETGNSYFTIERTTDGITYEKLGTVKGAGNSIYPVNYSFTDNNPLTGTSYYRLTQTSLDGTSNNFVPYPFETCNTGNVIKACFERERVSIFISSDNADTYQVLISNTTGKVLLNQSCSVAQGDNYFSASPNLTDGIYIITIVSTTNSSLHYTRKLIMGNCAYKG